MQPKMESRTALVIGGTKGMGRSISLCLAQDGFGVFACSRQRKDVDDICAEGRSLDLDIQGDVCDASDESSLNAFIDDALRRYGRIDAMVFAAGKAFPGSALDLSTDDWDACLGVNLRAPFVAAKRFIPAMAQQGGGALVFISSIWAFTTPRNRLAYTIAKSGLATLVRGLAVDHGADGIRANAVAPGYVETDFLHQSIGSVHGKGHVGRIMSDVLKAHPAGKLVTPDEVANTVAFLASGRSAGINGQTLIVDGGSTTKFSLADMWQRPS